MKRINGFLIVFTTLSLLFSCVVDEEPLKVNEAEANRQNALVDQINEGNGSTGNNGPTITEEFKATVDGVAVDYTIISFIEGVGASFGGSNNIPPSGVSFAILSLDTGKYDIGGLSATAAYSEGPNDAYEGFAGELIIDSLTNSYLIGTFSFDAKRIQGGTDTVKVTSGSFKVNR